MILGVGNDIIEISRIKRSAERTESFLAGVFTEEELKGARGAGRYESLAGYFAAKEAFSKALGTGVRGFSLKELEIFKDELGKPYIRVLGRAEAICCERGVKAIHLSIAHSKENATAFVVLEGE